MSIEIDGMPLIKHERDDETGKTKEIRSVYNISVSKRRRIVEHKIPGLEGGILQDLGREPIRISFDGVLYGEKAKEVLEQLISKFKAGKPLPFYSTISDIAEVSQVLIEDLRVEDVSSVTNVFKYSIVLREYLLPEEEEEKPPSQDEEAKKEVEDKADEAKNSINYVIGRVLDADGNPLEGVTVKITWDGGEYIVKTDKNGVYRKDNLKPGRYKITVEEPGYEGEEREVEIK